MPEEEREFIEQHLPSLLPRNLSNDVAMYNN